MPQSESVWNKNLQKLLFLHSDNYFVEKSLHKQNIIHKWSKGIFGDKAMEKKFQLFFLQSRILRRKYPFVNHFFFFDSVVVFVTQQKHLVTDITATQCKKICTLSSIRTFVHECILLFAQIMKYFLPVLQQLQAALHCFEFFQVPVEKNDCRTNYLTG